jgi:type IV pilus assembly protein PilZ
MPDRDSPSDRSDERAHPRGPIELKVEYERLNTFFSDYTKNISKGGTFIKTTKPLDIGTEFVFKLHVPTLDAALEILGRVQWVITPADIDAGLDTGLRGIPEEPGMGIRFVYADDAERAAIEQRVEQIMIENLGQLLYTRLMEQSRAEDAAAAADADDADDVIGGDDAREDIGDEPPA